MLTAQNALGHIVIFDAVFLMCRTEVRGVHDTGNFLDAHRFFHRSDFEDIILALFHRFFAHPEQIDAQAFADLRRGLVGACGHLAACDVNLLFERETGCTSCRKLLGRRGIKALQ